MPRQLWSTAAVPVPARQAVMGPEPLTALIVPAIPLEPPPPDNVAPLQPQKGRPGCCQLCGRKGHKSPRCPDKMKYVKCGHCGGPHFTRHCTAVSKRCFVCGKGGHSGRSCPQRECPLCKRKGHLVFQCPDRPKDCALCGSSEHVTRHCPANEAKKGRCHYCGKRDHVMRNCKLRIAEDDSGKKAKAPASAESESLHPAGVCRLCHGAHSARDCPQQQPKACSVCSRPGHSSADCPEQSCLSCGTKGHSRKNCPTALHNRLVCVGELAGLRMSANEVVQLLSPSGKVISVEPYGHHGFQWLVEFADQAQAEQCCRALILCRGFPVPRQMRNTLSGAVDSEIAHLVRRSKHKKRKADGQPSPEGVKRNKKARKGGAPGGADRTAGEAVAVASAEAAPAFV
eukprot:RCo042303